MLSWVLLRGRCRACGTPISTRYPLIEAALAGLFALTAATASEPSQLVVTLPIVFVATVLAAIDLETKRLPDALTLPLLGALPVLGAVGVGLGQPDDALIRGLVVGATSGAVFLMIALVSPSGFGLGDVKLAPSLGFAMGYLERGAPRAFIGFLLAFVLGSLVGLVLVLRGRAGRKTALPFGPFLVGGAFLAFWWGDRFVRFWLG